MATHTRERGFLTIGEAANVLGIHPQKLRRLEAAGVVPAAGRAERSRDRFYEPETVERIAVALVRHRLEAAA